MCENGLLYIAEILAWWSQGEAAAAHTIPIILSIQLFLVLQAVEATNTHAVSYPIRHGLIENWDSMEKLWQRAFFQYLRCDPEEHYVMLVRYEFYNPSEYSQLISLHL